jgi:hypothetical protein
MKITPNIWGPHGWKFLHYVTFAYPDKPSEEDKLNYKTFLTSLGTVLPCTLCSDNYKKHLLLYPLDDIVLSSNENLIRWGIDMHNEVNKLNNNKIYDYSSAKELILSNYHIEDTSTITPIKKINIVKSNNNLIILLFVIVLLIITLLVINIKNL